MGSDDHGEDEIDLDEREDPDINDADWNPDPDLIGCPYCGQRISEEAERCPRCGNYISTEDAPYRKKWWVLAGTIAMLLATLLTCLWWWT